MTVVIAVIAVTTTVVVKNVAGGSSGKIKIAVINVTSVMNAVTNPAAYILMP